MNSLLRLDHELTIVTGRQTGKHRLAAQIMRAHLTQRGRLGPHLKHPLVLAIKDIGAVLSQSTSNR